MKKPKTTPEGFQVYDLAEAMDRLCLGRTRLLEHLKEIGPCDEMGRPYFRRTSKHGAYRFTDEQLQRIYETLPSGVDATPAPIGTSGEHTSKSAYSEALALIEKRSPRKRSAKSNA